MLIPGGTYQGLYLLGGLTSNRANYVRFTDDIRLVGGIVIPGDDASRAAAESADYSLRLDFDNALGGNVQLQGKRLTTERGILIRKGSGRDNTTNRNFIDASDSTINIGGDLVYSKTVRPAGTTNTLGVLTEYRRIGLHGNATTVVNLGGGFRSNSRSFLGDNLYRCTVNLVGGTPEAPSGVEVMSDPVDAVAANTYAFGTLNVGTNSDPAFVRLDNASINDGDPANPLKTGAGEVLLAGALTVGPGSVLDVNGKGVKVATSLTINATGWLDLNLTGDLAIDQVIPNVFGVGNQSVAWAASAARVKCRNHPDVTFKAVYDSPNTVWAVASLGGGTLFLVR